MTTTSSDTIKVSVRVLNETDAAWLLTQEPYSRRGGIWVPKSRVEIVNPHEIGHKIARLSLDYARSKGIRPEGVA